MIGLMDCNNFFVSCERLFRPDLKKRPVAVLSSNDGCIVARSQEVKDLGIPMGAPLFQVQKECVKHGIVLFSSNFNLYRDISARVMNALREECGQIDVYSIDEAFFDVPNEVNYEKIVEIRQRIIQKTGIPVSIGIAKTKTLAKVANSIAKKQHGRLTMSTMGEGVCWMDEVLFDTEVRNMSCGSVWGIGRQTTAKLAHMGIHTVGDFLACDVSIIRREFGVLGERLTYELRGVRAPHSTHNGDLQDTFTSTRSFGRAVTDKQTLMSAISYHVSHVAEKLREHDVVASRLTVLAYGSRYGAFSHRTGSVCTSLTISTNDTFVLLREASRLLDCIYDPEIPYKKAGVVLSGIEPVPLVSGNLFGEEKMNMRTQALSELGDTLNARFGRDAVRFATTLGREKWQEHTEKLSPQYTTRWSEIARIKAK